MSTQASFRGGLLAFMVLAVIVFSAPLRAQNINSLQVMFLQGSLLDQKGSALELYDYLAPGPIYRLLPGTKVEMSTLDGQKVYVVQGPGVLAIGQAGTVTLNGKALSAQSIKSLLQGVTVPGKTNASLGATVMRSDDQVAVQVRQASGRTRLMRLYSGYHALVVGCGDYREGWPKLPNPVNDAREVAKLLEKMGWQVDLLEDPDWKTLRSALNRLITGPGRKVNQGVFLWFSGHGHTLEQADGSKLGYIVPVDAPVPHQDELGFMERAISMRQIETVALRVKAKHLLMAFDSCFSGSLFNITRAAPPPFIEEKVSLPVRQFITAGSENEKVPDKSLFKTIFVQGLADSFADLNKDGYITGQELGAYLQEKVVNYTRQAQHPQFGKINNPKLDKGDFVIVAKRAPAATAYPGKRTVTVSKQSVREKEIRETLQSWVKAWNDRDKSALLAHYSEDANIQTIFKGERIKIGYERFAEIIEHKLRWNERQDATFEFQEQPAIKFQGEKAKVIVITKNMLRIRGVEKSFEMYFTMVKQGSRWLIRKFRFRRM